MTSSEGKIPPSCLLSPPCSPPESCLCIPPLRTAPTLSPGCSRREAAHSDGGWTCRQRAAEGKVSLRSQAPLNGLWASEADARWRCKFVWGHQRWRQMNEEIEKSENHRSVYFIFSCRWSWAFNHTLSQGQGNPLATSPACLRTTHKNTFRCKRHGWVAQPVGRSTSGLCRIGDARNFPLFLCCQRFYRA